MSEKDFYECVEALCKRPQMYTPTGSFYEVASFLEGYGAGANVGELGYHSVFTPFFSSVAQKFGVEEKTFHWKGFRELFSSDLEALDKLPIFYREYLEHH